MAEVDPALVKLIAEKVMAALRQGSTAPPVTTVPADVRPPLGTCTGDYSKFPELARLQQAAPAAPASGGPVESAVTAASAAPAAAPPAPPAPSATPGAVLRGVITAERLKNIKGQILIAKGAVLTPLAQDYIKDHHLRPVEHGDGPQAFSAESSPRSTFYWWIEGGCPSVQNVVQALGPNLLASTHAYSADQLKAVVRELASMVKTKRVAGGVLFVPSAARAVVYANRCTSLRAIVGTCEDAVQQGIAAIGANVLIVEYPYHGTRSMLPMAQKMIEAHRAALPVVERELNELKSCGY